MNDNEKFDVFVTKNRRITLPKAFPEGTLVRVTVETLKPIPAKLIANLKGFEIDQKNFEKIIDF